MKNILFHGRHTGLCLSLLLWIPSLSLAQDAPEFLLSRPMTVLNQEELDRARNRALSGIEPQQEAYVRLIFLANAAQSFKPDPPESMDIMGGYEPNSNLSQMRNWLWRNAHAAYTSALAYAYTGEERYAEKAVEVLDAWAQKGTTFTGNDRGLQLGSWFSPMLYAYDLVHDSPAWTVSKRFEFQRWWRQKALGHVLDVMRNRENNWKDAGVLGTLAAGAAFHDTRLLEEGIAELRTYFEEKPGYNPAHLARSWKLMHHEGTGFSFLRHEVTRNEGSSGLTYTAYALTTMVQALEIARYAGHDLWHELTPQGIGVKDIIEWYFRWDIKRESFLPFHSSPNRTTARRNAYELAAVHFDLPEITEWLKRPTIRPVNGAQGDEHITLNKGGMDPIPVHSSQERPRRLSLDQNYPNPFNPATIIRFSLDEAEAVRLVVYDLFGREIEVLVSGFHAAGKHEVHFDAGTLASGVYLYRLYAGAGIQTRRMIHVK